MTLAFRIKIQSENDVYLAIHRAVVETESLRFTVIQQAKLKTSISELGSNILKYATTGYVSLYLLDKPQVGIKIIVSDNGPGIANVEDAMRDHYSTSGTLGLGLPGVRRLMDEFVITSELGKGTEVTIVLYK